ncbi:hypothetical protein D3C85_1237970 [compost metagenome]
MQLDQIEPGPVGAFGGIDKGRDHPVHARLIQRRGRVPVGLEGLGRGREGLPGLVGGGGAAAVDPRRIGRGLAPCVSQLDADGRIRIGADVADDPGEGGFLFVVPQAGVSPGNAPGRLDAGGLDHHQSGAGQGHAADVLGVPGLGHAVHGRILAHGGDDDAVLQRQRPDGARGEQQAHAEVFRCVPGRRAIQ